jgi:hypothetical protein
MTYTSPKYPNDEAKAAYDRGHKLGFDAARAMLTLEQAEAVIDNASASTNSLLIGWLWAGWDDGFDRGQDSISLY